MLDCGTYGDTPAVDFEHRIRPLMVVERHSSATLAIDDPELALALRYIHDHATEGIGVSTVLEQVPIYGELHRYIPVLASRRGFRIGELAVRHHPRRSGVSKYGWDRLYKGLLDLLTVLFITKYTRRPLHLFGVIGLLGLLCGFLINAWLAFLWAFRGEALSQRPLLFLGVLLMLAGLQVLTTGLLAEMTTHKTFRRTDSYSVREIVD